MTKIYGSPSEISPRRAVFLCLWLFVWSYPNPEIQISRKSAGKQEKSSLSKRKSWIFWSCYPDLNWGPHPYQLIASPPNTVFYRFGGIFVPWQRGLWHFPIHCFRPLISPCGSQCGSQCRSNSKINTCTM